MSGFVALVPVKPPALGKSRLTGVTAATRRALALSFALDTLDAVRATPGITSCVVVTSDDDVAALARRRGCGVRPDHGGLNDSLLDAARAATGRLVVVCGDLPALRPDDLADALAQLSDAETAYVADHLGTGTTTYVAPSAAFDPRFGPGSAEAHRRSGATAVDGDLLTLRRDVDTLDDLEELAMLGILGRHTTEVWANT